MGVPPKGGGGPGCFPLALGFVVDAVLNAVGRHHRAELSTIVDKTFQVGCIATIITKHRSDRRAADPGTIVSNLSLFRLPCLRHPSTRGICCPWATKTETKQCRLLASYLC